MQTIRYLLVRRGGRFCTLIKLSKNGVLTVDIGQPWFCSSQFEDCTSNEAPRYLLARAAAAERKEIVFSRLFYLSVYYTQHRYREEKTILVGRERQRNYGQLLVGKCMSGNNKHYSGWQNLFFLVQDESESFDYFARNCLQNHFYESE